MAKLALIGVNILTIILFVCGFNAGSCKKSGMCPWSFYENSTCPRSKFLCNNKNCIDRHLVCNGRYDCGDTSDESHCLYYGYCDDSKLRQCDTKCIPKEWFCDGIPDCTDGKDEEICGNSTVVRVSKALSKSLKWLYNQGKSHSTTEIWSAMAEKSAVAFYLVDSNFTSFNNGARKNIAYEVSIKLLSILSRTKLEDIPSTDLASFLNAFLVSCIDPRKFHGIDIVKELRNRVQKKKYTNPYVLLSLCNAGEKITESDRKKLVDTFWNNRRTFWTDMQSFSVMALVCASKQEDNEIHPQTLPQLTTELKQHQYKNGSIETLQTTALVMQALLAADLDYDPLNFDVRTALEQILSSQKPDGSFGNLMNTYFVLPVLSCNSLVNISSNHCKFEEKDEISALTDLANRGGPKKHVQYSLWIGNKKDMEINLVLRVPLNMSLYGIMEVAAEIDNRYNFEYVVENKKPYINALSNRQDNPETGNFWFLYSVKDGQSTSVQESPADVMPVDNGHFVMWYRSESWVCLDEKKYFVEVMQDTK